MPALGILAGGDWEMPVYYIIYWDDKKIRRYIPTCGAVFNPVSKSAFGNERDTYNMDYFGDEGGNLQKKFLDDFSIKSGIPRQDCNWKTLDGLMDDLTENCKRHQLNCWGLFFLHKANYKFAWYTTTF